MPQTRGMPDGQIRSHRRPAAQASRPTLRSADAIAPPRFADSVDPRLPESPPALDAEDSRRSGGFPRSARVRAKAEFAQVFAEGRRQGNAVLAVHYRADEQAPRLGLAVSRKVDKRATRRNRIKRVLRQQFRLLRARLAPGAYVVVARSGATTADGPALNEAFEQMLRRLRALPAPSPDGTMPAVVPHAASAASAGSAAPSSAPRSIDSSPSAPTSDHSDVTTPSAS